MNRIIIINQILDYNNIIKNDCINLNNYKSNIYNHLLKNNISNLKNSSNNHNNLKANIHNHGIFLRF